MKTPPFIWITRHTRAYGDPTISVHGSEALAKSHKDRWCVTRSERTTACKIEKYQKAKP